MTLHDRPAVLSITRSGQSPQSFDHAFTHAARTWHKRHLEHLKSKGLTPDLFEKYVVLFKQTMADLQLPDTRIDCAARFIQAAW
jgi:hypothetical protein